MFNKRAKENLKKVLSKIKINKNMKVADIGCGGGFYSFKFADKVKKVYSLDINNKFLNFVKKQAEKKGLENIETIYVKDRVKLPEKVDLIFIRNVYHHLENRQNYFKNLKKFLRKKGKIIIVEWEKSWFNHGTEKKTILKELKDFFRLKKDYKLPRQSFLIFEK